MFIEFSTTVDVGVAEVEKSLEKVRHRLSEWADVAYRRGEGLTTKVGPTPSIARQVSLDIGVAEVHNSGIVYPIRWKAAGATSLFPDLEADLTLSKRGAGETLLRLKGTYDPPLGLIGRAADRAGLHKVAEATVKLWMERLCEALIPSGD